MSVRDVQQRVDALFERPDEQGVSLATVVMHRGEVVAERYGTQPETPFEPARSLDADSTLISWSTAKSMTHAAVGILVADGRVDLAAPAPVPEWHGADKEHITLLDLLEMRPGLRFVEDYDLEGAVDGGTSHCIAMLFGEGAADHAAYAASLPLDHAPGTVWNYSSGTTNIITRIIGDVVGGGRPGMESFLRDRLFEPTGMTSAAPKFDEVGTWVGSSYVYATARDFARFGELYRNDGLAPSGDPVLPPGWLDHARTFVAHDPLSHDPGSGIPGGFDYGRHWWMWARYPGSLAAHGYEGQYVVVVPDRELVVVHFGKTPAEQRHHVVRLLMELIDDVPVTAAHRASGF
jgi:CubicO group peptidase (beta-lactamase class C family)